MEILPQGSCPSGAISLGTKEACFPLTLPPKAFSWVSSLISSSYTSEHLFGCWEDTCEPSFNHPGPLTWLRDTNQKLMFDSSVISSPEKKNVISPGLWSNKMSNIEQSRERERETRARMHSHPEGCDPIPFWYKAPLFQLVLPSGQNGPIKGKPSVHVLLSDVHKIPIVATFWEAQNIVIVPNSCSRHLQI